jgi:hypothetical protein
MLWSDVFGILAGALLAIPPIKDQYYRFSREQQKKLARTSPLPPLRIIIANAWEERRNDYDGRDTICLASGGIGIFLAFILKAFGA